jgi:hypothetical protein
VQNTSFFLTFSENVTLVNIWATTLLPKCCLNIGSVLKNTPKMRILTDFPMVFEEGFWHHMVVLSVPNFSKYTLRSQWICFACPVTLLAPVTASAQRFEKVEKMTKIDFLRKIENVPKCENNDYFRPLV